jgi:hypothetical protein
MLRITVDGTVQDFLASLAEDVEIRDAKGEILGYFKPWAVAEAAIFQKAKQFSDIDEVARRFEAEGRSGFYIDEIRQHLQALEQAQQALGLHVGPPVFGPKE